ncbi:MAG: hypothetical protein R3E82_10140 [Pseudomonadales bacterium]|nr:hypothetical protein [Pseudomonadales bacterium]
MVESAQQLLAPYYFQIKFVHLLFVTVWFMSTSVAYRFYLLPIFRWWMNAPEDLDAIRLRNWAMERFDDGAILEHIAFPMLLITGLMLMLVGGWTPAAGWFAMKLVMVVLVFIPVEIMDYHLAHFGGNKEKIRASGTAAEYEAAIHTHWWFLIVSSPIVIVTIPYVLYLAIVKPF